MLGMRSSHVGDHSMVPVLLTGRTDTFWDGLWCLSGAFCPFNGLRSTPNHFQTLSGHADKKVYPYPSYPYPPAAVDCAIQPLAYSSIIFLVIWQKGHVVDLCRTRTAIGIYFARLVRRRVFGNQFMDPVPVSYTHLTLPTIYSV